MGTLDTSAILWRCGALALLCTAINGLFLYLSVRFLQYGKASLVRSLIASTASSAVIILGFAIPATLAVQSCSFVGGFVGFLGAIVGGILTFPVQTLIFRLPLHIGVVVWLAYVISAAVVAFWTVFLSLWAGIF